MSTSYKAQIDNKNGIYAIQFETSNYDYFKTVEKACQKAIDKKDKAIKNGVLKQEQRDIYKRGDDK